MFDEYFYEEAKIPELDWGYTNFDNLASSSMSILQIMTLEGWNKMMYNYYDSWNPVFVSLYFSCVVLLGSFFVLNLLLAAIYSSFSKVKASEEEKKREAKLALQGSASFFVKKATITNDETNNPSATPMAIEPLAMVNEN
jgi:hypothetical protein